MTRTFPLNLYDRFAALAGHAVPVGIGLLFCRVAVGAVFWRSGLTKVDDNFMVTDATVSLFETSYHMPGWLAYPGTYAELLFPLMLFAGLGTRLGALGLIGQTLVIQLFVYPDFFWQEYALWYAMLLMPLTMGSGVLGLDRWTIERPRPQSAMA